MADALPAGVGDGVNRPTVLFTRVLPDHRPATVHVPSLAEQVAAPPQAASAAFAAPLTKWSWHVPAHAALETFLHSSGPSEMWQWLGLHQLIGEDSSAKLLLHLSLVAPRFSFCQSEGLHLHVATFALLVVVGDVNKISLQLQAADIRFVSRSL